MRELRDVVADGDDDIESAFWRVVTGGQAVASEADRGARKALASDGRDCRHGIYVSTARMLRLEVAC